MELRRIGAFVSHPRAPYLRLSVRKLQCTFTLAMLALCRRYDMHWFVSNRRATRPQLQSGSDLSDLTYSLASAVLMTRTPSVQNSPRTSTVMADCEDCCYRCAYQSHRILCRLDQGRLRRHRLRGRAADPAGGGWRRRRVGGAPRARRSAARPQGQDAGHHPGAFEPLLRLTASTTGAYPARQYNLASCNAEAWADICLVPRTPVQQLAQTSFCHECHVKPNHARAIVCLEPYNRLLLT